MMNDTEPNRKALESFVVDNPDLERLEALLDQFNIFEALNAVRVEVRHSDFLSFLLNPSQSHGLGDTFIKRLLQKALVSSSQQSLKITPVDLDIMDLNELIVFREWQNIDILLLDEGNHLAVIIENKIYSGEHGEQLKRYRQIVNQHYPDFLIVGLFLTPEGDQPSDESYFPIDYLSICEILTKLTESRAPSIGQDVRVLINHYIQMLRRHIVSKSEIEELCRRIYRKHQRAIDMIYEYRPDQQEAVREVLEKLIGREPGLVPDHSSKSYVRFGVKDWDVPALLQGEGWTSTKRMLLFQFNNFEEKLSLFLVIGPGPAETRQKILDIAHANQPPFKPAFHALGKKWNTIYVRQFLAASAYEESEGEDLEIEIGKKWKQFLENDLPKIQSALKSQEWIWKSQ